jgi:hypothetical protein
MLRKPEETEKNFADRNILSLCSQVLPKKRSQDRYAASGWNFGNRS